MLVRCPVPPERTCIIPGTSRSLPRDMFSFPGSIPVTRNRLYDSNCLESSVLRHVSAVLGLSCRVTLLPFKDVPQRGTTRPWSSSLCTLYNVRQEVLFVILKKHIDKTQVHPSDSTCGPSTGESVFLGSDDWTCFPVAAGILDTKACSALH